MQPLVIYGAGGHGREIAELVYDINQERPEWELLGFLSDDEGTWGTQLNGLPVLGGRAWLDGQRGMAVSLAIGSPQTRWAVAQSLQGGQVAFPTLRHPSAQLSRSAEVGPGGQVTAGCIVTVNVQIGAFAILNRMSDVSHDCRIGDYVTLAPGVQLGGTVTIGTGCDIGIGTSVIQGMQIGPWSVVGAGAAVTRSLPGNCTAVGVPARVIEERPPDWYRAR